MQARRTILIITLVALLVAAGMAVGANRAFKHTAIIPADQANVDHWLALPYRSSYQKASDLCTASPEASLVSRFDPVSKTRVDWTCPFGSNFDLTPGEGVIIRTQAASSPVFAGSHDPGLTIPVGGFTVAGVDHLIGLPYHTTAETAADVCAQVPDATLISRFDASSKARIDWTCPGGANFQITFGEALAVRVSQPNAGFIPEHY